MSNNVHKIAPHTHIHEKEEREREGMIEGLQVTMKIILINCWS